MKKTIGNIFIFIVISVFLAVTDIYAKSGRNIILVLDTSMSMIGYGGSDIFDEVKYAVYNYVDRLKDGDRVTFVTFDSETRIYPTVAIKDQHDRFLLKKRVADTEAGGQWTHTYDMLKNVYVKASELEKEKTRKTVIVIMTDGIDDPPPRARDERVDLDEVFSRVGTVDRFVYLVNFSDARDTPWFAGLRDKMAEYDVEAKLIDARDDPRRGIEEVYEDVERITAERRVSLWPLLIVIVVAAGAALFIVVQRNALLKVKGRLECWENTMFEPDLLNIDMTSKGAKTVYIGSGPGTMIYINGIEISSPFSIRAVREEGEIKMKFDPGRGNEAVFSRENSGDHLEDGTEFRIANYTFRYFSD